MYCKHCGEQLDGKAAFCSACGQRVNMNTSANKLIMAKVFSVVLIILCFYGIIADAITITNEGELGLAGFIILLLLTGCAIALYKIHVYLINIICFVALSLIYLVRIINLQEVLIEKFGAFIDFNAFKTLYWAYFITLSIFSIILVIKYLRENKNVDFIKKILSLRDCLKDTKVLTRDEMNSLVLSGMHEKGKGLFLIIGFVSSFIVILSNLLSPYPINRGNIISIISYLCIGLFLYALHNNIKNKKPFMQLNRCFNMALCAFIVQLSSVIISMQIRSISQLIIIIVVNTGLCFSFNKIRCGFKGKLGNARLKISIIFSMTCLCMNLVIRIFYGYTFFKDLYLPISFFAYMFHSYLFPLEIAETIVTITLLLLLNNMLRNLRTLAANAKALE